MLAQVAAAADPRHPQRPGPPRPRRARRQRRAAAGRRVRPSSATRSRRSARGWPPIGRSWPVSAPRSSRSSSTSRTPSRSSRPTATLLFANPAMRARCSASGRDGHASSCLPITRTATLVGGDADGARSRVGPRDGRRPPEPASGCVLTHVDRRRRPAAARRDARRPQPRVPAARSSRRSATRASSRRSAGCRPASRTRSRTR